MKIRILKILFLILKRNTYIYHNAREEVLDSYFRCIMDPKALCGERPNSRESVLLTGDKGLFLCTATGLFLCANNYISPLASASL